MEEEVSQVSVPRLCFMMREDVGYGFNLHGEKGVVGQYISAVDLGGSADKSGLCVGDRVIEVNGINVENSKHSEVVEHIRSDPEKTRLLVIDRVTDKYLAKMGRPVTADLAKLNSVTELCAPAEKPCNNIVNESEMVDRIEDLQFKEEEVTKDIFEMNGRVNVANDVQHTSEEKFIHHTTVENEVPLSETIEQTIDVKPKNSTEYEEEKIERLVEKIFVSTEMNMENPSEKSQDTEYYSDDSSVNALAGVESEDKSLKIDTPNDMYSPNLSSYEKVRPNTVPRRKEVKQGDWRAKLALFDQL